MVFIPYSAFVKCMTLKSYLSKCFSCVDRFISGKNVNDSVINGSSVIINMDSTSKSLMLLSYLCGLIILFSSSVCSQGSNI